MNPKKESQPDEPTQESVLQILTRILQGSQDVQKAALKQSAPKSNAAPPMISAFNPRGEKDFPMPKLKCEIFAPWKMTPALHGLTREEVELYNLLEPGEYSIELNDGSQQPFNVVGVKNQITGEYERLTLAGRRMDDGTGYEGLFTKDNKQLFPPMTKILRSILGEKAAHVQTMAEEDRMVKMELAAIKAGDPNAKPIHEVVSQGA